MPLCCSRPSAAPLRLAVLALTLFAWLFPIPESSAQDRSPTVAEIPEALNFANGLFRARRYDLAAEEYERFLEANPNGPFSADARFGLANARHFLQEYDKALRAFQAFVEQAPDHPNGPTGLFRVGELAYVLGELPLARQALEEFTAEHPEHRYLELAWPYLGDVRFRQGDLSGARTAYEQALATHPEGRLSDRARLYLGRALARLGDPEQALQRFEELTDRVEAAHRDEAHYQAGLLHLESARYDRAVDSFAALEQDSPNSTLLPQARLGRAEALVGLGEHVEAEAILRPLVADAPQNLAARAAYALGLSILGRGQAAEALTTFDDALERFPESPTAPALLFRSAEAAQKLGDRADAQTRFLMLVDADPADPWADDALLHAAGLALQQADAETASALADRFARQYPDNPLLANAHLVAARAALDGNPKRPGEAIRLLNDVLTRLQPDPATSQAARYYLGLAYRADGQKEKAAEVLDALAQTPAAPIASDAQFLVGQGHFEADRHAEAVQALEKYLQARPDGDVAENALAYLVLSYNALGRHEQADATLQRLAEEYPEGESLGTTRLRLAEQALARENWPLAAELYRLVARGNDATLAPMALSGLGWALYQDGQPSEAADAFAALLEAEPDHPMAPEAAIVRGRALEDLKQSEAAIEAYRLVNDRYPDSEQAAPATLARARLLADADRSTEAAELYELYLDQHPDGAGEPVDLILADWGWALYRDDRPDEADDVFRRLLEEFPDGPRSGHARLNLAESAFQAGELDDVADLLAPLVDEAPGEVEPRLLQSALYRLGRTQVEQEDWETAAGTFGRLVEQFPEGLFRREAQFWASEVAFRLDRFEEAEAGFAKLTTEPTNDEAEPWLLTARLRRVQGLNQLRQWSDALEEAEALANQAPEFPQMAELDYERGRALQQIAPPRFEEARAAYQAVIDARKGGDLAAQAQFMRGETYYHEKDYRQALREFLKAALTYDAPRWQSLALLEAGKVYEELDQWADAADIYEKLRSDFPDEPATAEGNRRLTTARERASTRPGE
ncbi:hypothetical protein BH23PLA1_BH23PLA1_13180 [soil metagenome]